MYRDVKKVTCSWCSNSISGDEFRSGIELSCDDCEDRFPRVPKDQLMRERKPEDPKR